MLCNIWCNTHCTVNRFVQWQSSVHAYSNAFTVICIAMQIYSIAVQCQSSAHCCSDCFHCDSGQLCTEMCNDLKEGSNCFHRSALCYIEVYCSCNMKCNIQWSIAVVIWSNIYIAVQLQLQLQRQSSGSDCFHRSVTDFTPLRLCLPPQAICSSPFLIFNFHLIASSAF